MKLLQKTYYRKVKMIYIDLPYNAGNDFVYADEFADPMARYKEVTQQTTKSNPETMRGFYTNWLNMICIFVSSINNKTICGVGDDCLILVYLAENVQPENVE